MEISWFLSSAGIIVIKKNVLAVLFGLISSQGLSAMDTPPDPARLERLNQQCVKKTAAFVCDVCGWSCKQCAECLDYVVTEQREVVCCCKTLIGCTHFGAIIYILSLPPECRSVCGCMMTCGQFWAAFGCMYCITNQMFNVMNRDNSGERLVHWCINCIKDHALRCKKCATKLRESKIGHMA